MFQLSKNISKMAFYQSCKTLDVLFRVMHPCGAITIVAGSWLGAASGFRGCRHKTKQSGLLSSNWLPVWAYLDDSGGSQVPLPFLCQLLRNGHPVVHHKGPALAAQVNCPEEEVLLMLVHLPRKRGFDNLSTSMQPLVTILVQPRYTCAQSKPPSPPAPTTYILSPVPSSCQSPLLSCPFCTAW